MGDRVMLSLLEVEGLTCQRMKETAAEQADCQQTAEQENRIDAFPALALPINITQIQPKGKFIQGQSGAGAVKE